MHRHNTSGYKVFAADLTNKKVLILKLTNLRQYYITQLKLKGYSTEEISNYSSSCAELMVEYLDAVEFLFHGHRPIVNVLKLDVSKYDTIIFEGAQGIMLDMDHGIFPHVTYSNTTSKNALSLYAEWGLPNLISIVYVTRCYQTRHGNGPMTSDEDISLLNNSAEINVYNEWQKDFKVKKIDYELLGYALDLDRPYHPVDQTIQTNLLITCNDQLPENSFDLRQILFHSNFKGHVYKSFSPDQISITEESRIL